MASLSHELIFLRNARFVAFTIQKNVKKRCIKPLNHFMETKNLSIIRQRSATYVQYSAKETAHYLLTNQKFTDLSTLRLKTTGKTGSN